MPPLFRSNELDQQKTPTRHTYTGAVRAALIFNQGRLMPSTTLPSAAVF